MKCTCDPRTSHFLCPTKRGQCMCKATNFSGKNCDRCAKSFEGFPQCTTKGEDFQIEIIKNNTDYKKILKYIDREIKKDPKFD